MDDVIGFRWSVPAQGFRLQKAKVHGFLSDRAPIDAVLSDDRSQWVLTTGTRLGWPFEKRWYEPLSQHTGLFRTFADLPFGDPRAILEFANRFGGLGISRSAHLLTSDEKPGEGSAGEALDDWGREITAMRIAVEAWDTLVRQDEAGLAGLLQWEEYGWASGWRYTPPSEWDGKVRYAGPNLPRAPSPLRAELLRADGGVLKPDDISSAAWVLVQGWVNARLEGKVSPKLIYLPADGRQVLHLTPGILLDAMWLQFAQAIDGRFVFHACRVCRKWFQVSHKQADHRTVRREFCSDPCKSRDYRRRKEAAVRLKAEGRSIKDIAAELDTDLETVKKWVGARKGK